MLHVEILTCSISVFGKNHKMGFYCIVLIRKFLGIFDIVVYCTATFSVVYPCIHTLNHFRFNYSVCFVHL